LSIIPADLNDVYFIDELNGWIVGDDGSMIKTTNGGNNWDVLYRESTENIKQVQFANQDTGWVIAGCNIIKTETGGGETCSLPYPILDEPNNYSEAFPDKVTLRWHTVIGATSYRLQISKSPVFIDPIYDEERLILTSQIISDLDTGMVYFWRVNASNDTFTSLWSDTWLFTTYEISLSAPVLNSPSDGSVDQPVSIILSWNESDDADKYYLQVDNDPDFSSPIIDNEFILSESEFVFNLDINTTYYWRVKALNYNGSMSPWSETWIFTTTHSVGINESGYDTRYKLYPNPVNDVLFVEGFENELTNISILSLEGKLLKQIKEKGMIQIDVSDLQNGIYLVKIVNSKIMITEKIVKQ